MPLSSSSLLRASPETFNGATAPKRTIDVRETKEGKRNRISERLLLSKRQSVGGDTVTESCSIAKGHIAKELLINE
uniref:Uncharacterized protein n=1 Tax=Syphacia muris TaxID=451379 RepID=A0A0N5AAN4_9BILA